MAGRRINADLAHYPTAIVCLSEKFSLPHGTRRSPRWLLHILGRPLCFASAKKACRLHPPRVPKPGFCSAGPHVFFCEDLRHFRQFSKNSRVSATTQRRPTLQSSTTPAAPPLPAPSPP